MKRIAAATPALAPSTGAALAWGDDGNKVVALIAEYYLTPTAKRQVDALLASMMPLAGEPDDRTAAAA
jgi:hypothetical protein